MHSKNNNKKCSISYIYTSIYIYMYVIFKYQLRIDI